MLCGGDPADGPGHFYPLTLVTSLRDKGSLVDKEQSGSALPILRHNTVNNVIAAADAHADPQFQKVNLSADFNPQSANH